MKGLRQAPCCVRSTFLQALHRAWPSPLTLSSQPSHVPVSTQRRFNSQLIQQASGFTTTTRVYKGASQTTALYLQSASERATDNAALCWFRHSGAEGCHQSKHSVIHTYTHTPLLLRSSGSGLEDAQRLCCQVTSRCFENAKSFRGHFLRLPDFKHPSPLLHPPSISLSLWHADALCLLTYSVLMWHLYRQISYKDVDKENQVQLRDLSVHAFVKKWCSRLDSRINKTTATNKEKLKPELFKKLMPVWFRLWSWHNQGAKWLF